jgi:hypothetical protein
MPNRIAGIDVHKKMLAVVVSDVEIDGEFHFERRMFGANPEQLRWLAAWLLEQEAEEVVASNHPTLNPPNRKHRDFRACSAHRKKANRFAVRLKSRQ